MRVLQKRSDYLIFALVCAILAVTQISIEYYKWQNFSAQSYRTIKGEVGGISFKHSKSGRPFETICIEANEGRFCFWANKESKSLMFHNVEVVIPSDKIDFRNWLGSKYVSANGLIDLGDSNNFSVKRFLYEQIVTQHPNYEIVRQLYLSLYLNMPIDEELQNKVTDYDLSAILALSGLNVILLWGFMWAVLSPIYSFFQNRFFPYRSKSLDLGIFILAVIFAYLEVTDFAPSFVRALAMSAFAFFIVQRGFKLASFETLIIVVSLLLAFFPTFIVSLGFWLSVIAVWLIFIFERSLSGSAPKWALVAMFMVWIWAVMIPIIHLIFPIFNPSQLASPIYNALFDYFYPISIVLHLIGLGGIFDDYLNAWLSAPSFERSDLITPKWFGAVYIACGLLGAKYKLAFYAFTLMAVLFFVMSYFMR